MGGSAKPKEVSDWIAEAVGLPDSQREEILKSGQERFHNQVQWARQYLVWEGLLDSSRRGIWTFTTEAVREANRDGAPPVELVDGETLVSMFELAKLGVIPKVVYEIDQSFFDQFRNV